MLPDAWYTVDYGDGGVAAVTTTQTGASSPTVVSSAPVPTVTVPVAAAPASTAQTFIAAISVLPPTPTFAYTTLPLPAVTIAPRYAAGDYAGAALALLPRGRVWQVEPGGPQAGVLAAIGAGLARVDAAAGVLLALPGQPTPLLPEWEAALGLPDLCAGPAPTIAQRTSQVRARFAGAGSQSRNFYVAFAAALGFSIVIETFAPFRAGHSHAGARVCGAGWSFVWAVHILNDAGQTGAFRVGAARAGDPLSTASYARAVLECEFDRLKSAETILLFPS